MSPHRLRPLLLVLGLGPAAAAPPGGPASAPTSSTAPRPQAAQPVPLDVEAERMELDQAAGTVRFEGGVRAQRPGFSLRCTRLRARLAEDGGLTALVAEGPIAVTVRDWHVTAGHATYDPSTGLLELTEGPTVRRGPDHLAGERVQVWPEAGRVVVLRARGTVSAPGLSALEAATAPASRP